MGKIRVGNKQNSYLNGQWAGHARKFGKFVGNKARRFFDKKEIKEGLKEDEAKFDEYDTD